MLILYKFEREDEFKYLGSTVTHSNDISYEIKQRLMAANRAYFALRKLLCSRILSRTTKVTIYKTLIRPVLSYAAETWSLTKKDVGNLDAFERKILRKIIGPVFERGRWRRRYNNELYSIYKDPPIRRIVKAARLRWAGHVARMNDAEIPKMILNGNPGGQRSRGRPRIRWLDGVEEDIRKMGYRNWRAISQDRDNWRKIVEEAKVHTEL